MIWATVSSGSFCCSLYGAFPFLVEKNINSLISVLTIWWFHVESHLLCCWKKVFVMTNVFSWKNSFSLCPASFCTPRPNLPVTPGISWLPTFAFQSPMMKRTSFVVLVLKGLVGFHRTVQLQLLQDYWSGNRLGLPWYWMVCLGDEQRSLSFLRLHPSTAFRTLLLTMMATSFLLRDSCPQ